MMRVYICYSQEDYTVGKAISSLLREEGIRVFIDKDTIPAGAEWQRLIEREIPSSDYVILLWSKNSARSPWVVRELSLALMNNRPVIPCALDDERMTPLVEHLQILKWDDTPNSIERLKVALGIDHPDKSLNPQNFTLEEARKKYRETIMLKYGSLRALGQGADFPIEKIYLPLYIGREIKEGQVRNSIPAEELLNSPQYRIVILGHPGTGKSTLLRYLAFKAGSSKFPYFAVYVRIADLMRTDESIIDFVSQQIKGQIGRRFGEIISLSDDFCRAGTTLLLDGIDEITEVDYQDFQKRLNSFQVAQPDAKVILTSRFANFNRRDFENYVIYQIQQLSPVDIEKYIWLVCPEEHRERVWATVNKDSRLFELARTPFLLAMICASPESLGTRATQRATLFKACTSYLLRVSDWEESSPGRPKESEDIARYLEDALKTIAVRFFKLDVRETFQEEEILFVIRSMSNAPSTIRPPEILERICSHSGLLQSAGASYYFIHRSIWEYFVALGMRDEPLENLLARANIPAWEEPIRLFVGLSPERELSAILEGLWAQNKGLALRAMMELPIFPHELLNSLVGVLERQERIRLVFQLEDNLHNTSNLLDARRMLLDTISALLRVERDCEVIYQSIRLLELYAEKYGCEECLKLVEKILDLANASKRRKKLLTDPTYFFKFIFVSGGEFIMGTDNDNRTPDEKPSHPVKLDSFWIGQYPVTNKVFYSEFPFTTERREIRSNRETQPVIYPTWYEAYIFAKWLGCDLPTEAEWEYTCRSGGQDDGILFDYDHISEYAWYIVNSGNETHDVGTKKPNTFGIYDMLGNVREWCKDWFGKEYYQECLDYGVIVNPQGPLSGTRKVIRGGCFDWNVANLVPTYRNYNPPDNSYFVNGFRLVFRGEMP